MKSLSDCTDANRKPVTLFISTSIKDAFVLLSRNVRYRYYDEACF